LKPVTAIVRHGQSEANAGLATTDPSTIPITALGEAQAKALAASFQTAPSLVVRSPFVRTHLTASVTLARFPYVPVQEWPIHEFTFLSPARHRNTSVAQRRPAVQAYWDAADPDSVDGYGAESFATFWSRVESFWTRIQAAPEGTVAFGHGQFMQLLLFQRMGYERVPTSQAMKRFRLFAQGLLVPNTARIWIRQGQCSGLDMSHLTEHEFSI
jgi:broad specificity phosphatase PhoE